MGGWMGLASRSSFWWAELSVCRTVLTRRAIVRVKGQEREKNGNERLGPSQ